MGCVFAFDVGTTSLGAGVAVDGVPVWSGVSILRHDRYDRDARLRRERRRRRRRRRRIRALAQLLAKAGLYPEGSGERIAIDAEDPWLLRGSASQSPLTAHQIGRILLHMYRRRGRWRGPSRLVADRSDPPLQTHVARHRGKVRQRRAVIRRAHLALEDFLAIPDRWRDDVVAELDDLLTAQARFHPRLLDPALVSAIRDFFVERSTARDMDCEGGEGQRQPVALPSEQARRSLSRIAALRTVGRDGKLRRLSHSGRARIANRLLHGQHTGLSELRFILALEPGERIVRPGHGEAKALKPCRVSERLRLYPEVRDKWNALALWRRDALFRLAFSGRDSDLVGDDAAIVAALRKEARSFPSGTVRASAESVAAHAFALAGRDADGLSLSRREAVRHAVMVGGDCVRPCGRRTRRHDFDRVFREVLAAMIGRYGVPDRILFEDLRLPAPQAEPPGRSVDALLHAQGLPRSPGIRRRARLWLRQRAPGQQVAVLAYDGSRVTLHEMVAGGVEIDHVAPISAGGARGRINQLLCRSSINAFKAARGPVRVFGPASGTAVGSRQRDARADLLRAGNHLEAAVEIAEDLAPAAAIMLKGRPAADGPPKNRNDLRHHGVDALLLLGCLPFTAKACAAATVVRRHVATRTTPSGNPGAGQIPRRVQLAGLELPDRARIADPSLREAALACPGGDAIGTTRRVRLAWSEGEIPLRFARARRHGHVDIVRRRDGTWRMVAPPLDGGRPDWERDGSGSILMMRLRRGALLRIDRPGAGMTVMAVHRLSPSNGVVYLAGHAEGGNLDSRHRDPGDPFRWTFASATALRRWSAALVDLDALGPVTLADNP